MRSSLSLVFVLAACGSDVDPSCQTSYLTYANFGAPFMISWCRGCHSVETEPSMRQKAPADVNFDTLDEIRAHGLDIERDTGDLKMPPAGGPSEAERQMLVEWIRCGAR